MIGYIKGKVISNKDYTVLLENNGIGYEISCSSQAFCRLISDREGGVYTYLQVKDDGLALFGFDSPEEKQMFLRLISVSGVGAKMGMTVLSGMSLKDLALAIATSDVKTLSRIKGLGKKTAERIIVELRETIGKIESEDSGMQALQTGGSADGDNAVTALIGLGFNRVAAVKAVGAAINNGEKTIEDIIAYALRSFG